MADLETWTLKVQTEADQEDLELMDTMRLCLLRDYQKRPGGSLRGSATFPLARHEECN